MEENSTGVKIFLFCFIILFFAPIIFGVVQFVRMFFPDFRIDIWGVLWIVLGIIIAWIVSTYNKFVSLNQRVKQAQGGIDVYLKKRFDLIPNLVETVKGYKEHEEKLLTDIAKLRADYETRNDEDIKQSEELNNRFTKLIAIAEKYPELKASEQFLNLQKNLSKVESELQAARRIYNSEVTTFNTKRLKFPSNIIGAIFGFKEKTLFEIEDYERENVDVKI